MQMQAVSPFHVISIDLNINWDPVYWYGLTSIPAWVSNHFPSEMWDEIIHPFPKLNGCT